MVRYFAKNLDLLKMNFLTSNCNSADLGPRKTSTPQNPNLKTKNETHALHEWFVLLHLIFFASFYYSKSDWEGIMEGPVKSHQEDEGTGATLPWGEAERAGTAINIWREGGKKMQPGSPQWCPVPGQEAMGTSWHTEGSLRTPAALVCKWQSGADLPGDLSKHMWHCMRHWAPCSVSLLEQGLGPMTSRCPFPP